MKEKTFLCVGWLPIILCPLLLLALTCFFEWRDIEEKVKNSSEAALSSEQFNWAKIETYNRGRNVLITGTAPNEQAALKAKSLVDKAYGVRVAEHNGDIAPVASPPIPLSPASLTAITSGNTIKLSGVLSSPLEVDQALSTARRTFGSESVINALTVKKHIAPLPSLNFIEGLRTNKQTISSIKADLQQGSIYLSGTVAEESVSQAIERGVQRKFSGKIINNLIVEQPTFSSADCQALVSGALTKNKVNFEIGKAVISPSSFPLLDSIVAISLRCNTVSFEVGGHTDSTGQLALNIKLSEARAQSVIEYLLNKGLSAKQFSAKGYGPELPIADNATAQGRAKNRRIEFTLQN